jgi:hypothetical protein
LPTINSSGSAGAALGATLNASATVSGGYAPGGTVTFAVYGNATGTGTPIYTETEPLSGGAATAGTSGSRYTFTAAGTYSWVATYNGDGDNTSVSTAPTVVTVAEDAPTLKLTPTQTSASSGAAVSASAALSGGYSPGGTVTFKLYSDPDASGTPVCQSTIALAGGSATSAGCTVMQTGTYYWVASYSGDANNVAVSTPVAAAPVTITAVSAAGGGASGGGSTSGSGGSGSTTVSRFPVPSWWAGQVPRGRGLASRCVAGCPRGPVGFVLA